MLKLSKVNKLSCYTLNPTTRDNRGNSHPPLSLIRLKVNAGLMSTQIKSDCRFCAISAQGFEPRISELPSYFQTVLWVLQNPVQLCMHWKPKSCQGTLRPPELEERLVTLVENCLVHFSKEQECGFFSSWNELTCCFRLFSCRY